MARAWGRPLATGVSAITFACGGGGSDPGHEATLAKPAASGDGQSGSAGTTLPDPLRVIVTQDGTPVAGRLVGWSVLANGGAVTPPTSTTGADGIATTSVTLPPFAATSSVRAIASGISTELRFSVRSTGATSTATIQVANNEFLPDNVELQAGGTVSFVWLPTASQHNVRPIAPNTIPRSENPPPPGLHNAPYSFDTRFTLAGSYSFFCEAHGTPTSGMRGTVTVVP